MTIARCRALVGVDSQVGTSDWLELFWVASTEGRDLYTFFFSSACCQALVGVFFFRARTCDWLVLSWTNITVRGVRDINISIVGQAFQFVGTRSIARVIVNLAVTALDRGVDFDAYALDERKAV